MTTKREIEREWLASWDALGITQQQRETNDDPDCQTLDQCVRIALTYEREQREDAQAEVMRLRAVLAKIDAIRNNIIGAQGVNWSRDIYPLVAALSEAGFEGEGYDAARARLLGQTTATQPVAGEKSR